MLLLLFSLSLHHGDWKNRKSSSNHYSKFLPCMGVLCPVCFCVHIKTIIDAIPFNLPQNPMDYWYFRSRGTGSSSASVKFGKVEMCVNVYWALCTRCCPSTLLPQGNLLGGLQFLLARPLALQEFLFPPCLLSRSILKWFLLWQSGNPKILPLAFPKCLCTVWH